MASRRIEPGRPLAAAAIEAAVKASTPDPVEIEPGKKGATRQVNIRLSENEYRALKTLFSNYDVPLAVGVRISALYVSELVKDGALKLSSAGIIDRRGG